MKCLVHKQIVWPFVNRRDNKDLRLAMARTEHLTGDAAAKYADDVLLANAYLQGVRDAARAMKTEGYAKPALPWQAP